ncbi:helix-turn-helix domain-containing protein [Micromonospora sp. WMMD961]|uniref:PucR family transcriptional regulator n=1 Tax=Micromonospora sp. WMMD961 TaxID=3016100 RepID=UPI0024171BDB|nr:helix-turn-helix domain-containing protein [Micromonospora sp. WMMD961]MDG4782169.1 helix-turn-helix domain-containing protein [Micromonospora sp. WMMD961]
MRLNDLLGQADLKLTMLSGHSQGGRVIQQFFTTDLLDPSRYLSGGEVVLTGLMWRRTPKDSEVFATAVARAGVSAVGAGAAAFGGVPVDVVEACSRHDVPVFEVPVEVSFTAISDAIGAALRAEKANGLAAIVHRHRGLIAALTEDAHLADLLPSAAADISCWVLSPTGRLVAGTSPIADDLRARLARTFLTAPQLPHVLGVARNRRYTLFAAGAHPGRRLGAWLFACSGDATTWNSDRRQAVDGLLTLLTLERAHLDRQLRVERRLAALLLEPLVSGTAPAEIAARLKACRLDPDATFVVLTAGTTAGPPDELALTVVEELVRPLAPAAAIAAVGAEVHAVIPVDPRPDGDAATHEAGPADGDTATTGVGPPDIVERIRQSTRALTPGLRGERFVTGLSAPAHQVAALGRAVEEARHAYWYALTGDDQVEVVSSGELSSHALLLASVPVEARRAFHRRLLHPLTEYDRSHDARLVHTLDMFLHCDGSWTRTAKALHVHVNTLRYRIQRIEQLTGRKLHRFDDRVDLYLALELQRH